MGDGRRRADLAPGMRVRIVLKADQRTGKRTEGTPGGATKLLRAAENFGGR